VVKTEIQIIKELLNRGANVNRTDQYGSTCLHMILTVFSKDPQRCAYITELLATSDAKVNVKNNENWTPLHLAIKRNQEKGV
jgi:ankyrin repeat protein